MIDMASTRKVEEGDIQDEDDATSRHARLPSLLTVTEAAVYMGVKPKTVYGWVETGRLPCLRAGNSLRFRLCDLERWLGVPERRQ